MNWEQINRRLEHGFDRFWTRVMAWAGPDGVRLRRVLIALAVLWLLLALAKIVWALLPVAPTLEPPAVPLLNPLTAQTSASGAVAPVAVDKLLAWHLFGKPGQAVTREPVVVRRPVDQGGIERGAKESKLNITLTGIVAMSDEGFGMAIIEHSRKQQLYAVGDELPIGGGQVKLAKVLADRVVIDNRGTYELIRLFEQGDLVATVREPASKTEELAQQPTRAMSVKRDDAVSKAIARQYRQRLYNDPQSLAEVVKISAHREQGQLRGYRVRPGNDKQQFEQLGFKAGDLVTSVNGIPLDNPSNAVQLYQLMRTASEAVFEVERGSTLVTLTVMLGNE
ncbi:MAG: type II secretion system protein GspC [Gammaproteobacteria bacterium]|nr:MAG: type II secretion system protein GspC [Gammaproteobacteria bacterium]